MGNSQEPDDFCQSENELVVEKIKIKIGPSADLKKTSINSQTSIQNKDESTDNEVISTSGSSGKGISEEEDNKGEPQEIPDEESAYSGESFCSDNSSESESETTDVTPRSLLSASSSLSYNARKRSESAAGSNITNDDDKIFELTDDMRYLSMDYLGRMSSSQQRFSLKRRNMTFTNEELMKIDRDNQILLQRIMKFQRPQNKLKPQNVQTRLSSSAINRRKVQRKIEEDNMLLLRKIQEAKPHVLSRAKSASCRLKFN